MNLSEIPPKLIWECRRGMLELDVWLGNFLKEAYLSLSPEDKVLFEKLLQCNDQDLFDWLSGKKPANDPDIAYMVKKVKTHAKNRHRAI